MAGFCAMILANGAVCLASGILLHRVKTGQASLDLILFILIRAALISALVILAGLTGLLKPLPLALVSIAFLGIATMSGTWRQAAWPLLPLPDRTLKWVLGLVLLKTLIQVWIFAPYNVDALSYHLPKIAEWVRAGAFTREMGVDTHASFPAGFELMETWWVLFLHHDGLIEGAALEFLVLGFSAVYALAEYAGLSPKGALLAATAFLLMPAVLVGATSTVNDVPIAALILATAALLTSRVALPLILLASGLGIGVKPIFAYAFPGLLCLWLMSRNRPSRLLPSRSIAMAVGVLGLAVGGFWYARNLAWYGNAVHPVGSGGVVLDSGQQKIQMGPSLDSALGSLSDLVENKIYDRSAPYSSYFVNIAGWGPAVFACGLPVLMGFLKASPQGRALACGLGGAAVSVFLLVMHDPWNLRFVIFLPALFCLALAWGVERHPALIAIVAASFVFQFVATWLPGDVRWSRLRVFAGQDWRHRSLGPALPEPASREGVAYYGLHARHNRGEAYLLYGPGFERRVVYLRSTEPETLLGEMKAGGVRTLYVASTLKESLGPIQTLLGRRLLQQVGERIYILAPG